MMPSPKPPCVPNSMPVFTPPKAKAPSIDWRSGLKDGMWAMFWVKQNVDPDDIEADKAALKENVAKLIRMTTQKNAGQRGAKECINWNNLDNVLMMIACTATSLCLSGELGEMPETIEGDI